MGHFIEYGENAPWRAFNRTERPVLGGGRLLLTIGAIAALIVLISQICISTPEKLEQDKIKVKSVVKLYAMSMRGEALLRALARRENGRAGNECGHDNNRVNQEPYGTACLPDGSQGYARGAVAIHKALETWVLSDDFLRKQFLKFFANWYHSSAEPDRNEEYRKLLATLYLQEYRHLKQTEYIPMTSTAYKEE